MGSKADRRARKKANKALKPPVTRCERCGFVPAQDNHDTAFSRASVNDRGEVFIAWCPQCGWDYAV